MTTETRTTHTPGPWEIRRTIDKNVERIDSWQYEIKGANEISGMEAEANARLIAAAPALLAALEALFTECAMVHKHWGEGSNQKQANAAIAAGKAAIAAAKGDA